MLKILLRKARNFTRNHLLALRLRIQNPKWHEDIARYRSMDPDGFPFDPVTLFPILKDRSEEAGTVDHHYFHQDIWVARAIMTHAPNEHYDVGSRLDGFISHLLVFRTVKMIDVRPLAIEVPGLEFVRGNATDLSMIPDDSIESLSCLHAIEHFGLGRYGDPIDPQAPRKAASEFVRVLKPGGRLYLSTPCGPRNQLHFNAHRVFDPSRILEMFSPLKLVRIDGTLNDHVMHSNVSIDFLKKKHYSLGIFIFEKAC